MTKYRDVFICLLLLLGSLVPRLLLISKGPFTPDALNLAIIAERTLLTGQLHAQYGTGYPLLVLITAGFVGLARLFGCSDPVVGANLMGVTCGALSVVVIYFLGRRILDRPAAIISAVLFSLSPIFFGTSVYGTGQAAEHIFLGGGLILLWEYARGGRWRVLAAAALVFGLMGAVRLQDLAFVSPAIVFFLLFVHPPDNGPAPGRGTWSRGLREVLLLGAVVATVIALFHLPLLLGPNSTEYLTRYRRFQSATFMSGNFGVRTFMFGQFRKWLTQNFSVLGLTALLLGLLLMTAQRRRLTVFLLIWILGPMIFYVLIDTTIPRLLVIVLPPMCVFTGYLLGFVYGRGSVPGRTVSAGMCVLIGFIMFMEVLPFVRFRHEHALVPEMVQWVREQVPDNAHMVLLDEHLFYEHYGNFPVLSRPRPRGPGYEQRLAGFQSRLEELTERGVPVYATGVGIYSDDVQQRFASFLKERYEFNVIGAPFFEDWHHGELKNFVFRNIVIRLSPKAGGDDQ